MSAPRLNIFIRGGMVQIKRGRKSIELMAFDEADQLGRDLCLAVAAARAAQPTPVPGFGVVTRLNSRAADERQHGRGGDEFRRVQPTQALAMVRRLSRHDPHQPCCKVRVKSAGGGGDG